MNLLGMLGNGCFLFSLGEAVSPDTTVSLYVFCCEAFAPTLGAVICERYVGCPSGPLS